MWIPRLPHTVKNDSSIIGKAFNIRNGPGWKFIAEPKRVQVLFRQDAGNNLPQQELLDRRIN